jgi:hypothetical protein
MNYGSNDCPSCSRCVCSPISSSSFIDICWQEEELMSIIEMYFRYFMLITMYVKGLFWIVESLQLATWLKRYWNWYSRKLCVCVRERFENGGHRIWARGDVIILDLLVFDFCLRWVPLKGWSCTLTTKSRSVTRSPHSISQTCSLYEPLYARLRQPLQ